MLRAWSLIVLAFSTQPSISQTVPAIIYAGRKQVIGGMPGGGLVMGQTRCDPSGNVYFRQVQGSNYLLSPIVFVSADGERSKIVDFSGLLAREKDLRSLQVYDFDVHDSRIYLLGSADHQPLIAEYNVSDGQLEDILSLQAYSAYAGAPAGDLTPTKLGTFPSGEFVVLGVRTTQAGVSERGMPEYRYAASIELYDTNGRFLRSASMSAEDADLNSKTVKNAERFQSFDLSLTADGPDGVYIITYAEKPAVYVISPSGEVTRRSHFSPPGDNWRPLHAAVIGPELLIEYIKSDGKKTEYCFVSYSTFTGEIMHEYEFEPGFSGIFACYSTGGQFKFISSNSAGQRSLIFAQAR